jgi:plastocyanin
MKKFILSLFLLLTGLTGFSKTWIITNSGTTFTPATLTIETGDSVKFTIGSMHNVVEVSKDIWDVGEASPLVGGFQLPNGGGTILPTQLSTGMHCYVCVPHVSLGMKGSFLVLGPTSIPDPQFPPLSLFPNPADDQLAVKANMELIGSNYIIFDGNGKQVSIGKLENEETNIPLNGLSSGIYFLQTNAEKKQIFTFIKN